MDVLYPIWYVLPAYFANSSPVLASKIPIISRYNFPLDLKKRFVDGNRIFGDGKTALGFSIGILVGTTIGALQGNAVLGFLLSVGTMVGDSVGSFVKRRMGITRGVNSPLVDDLFFLIFALGFAWFSNPVGILSVLELLILTPVIHRAANIIAHLLRLKEVPW